MTYAILRYKSVIIILFINHNKTSWINHFKHWITITFNCFLNLHFHSCLMRFSLSIVILVTLALKIFCTYLCYAINIMAFINIFMCHTQAMILANEKFCSFEVFHSSWVSWTQINCELKIINSVRYLHFHQGQVFYPKHIWRIHKPCSGDFSFDTLPTTPMFQFMGLTT